MENFNQILGENIWWLVLLYFTIMLREVFQSIIVGIIWKKFTHLEEDDVVHIDCGRRKCRIQKLGLVNITMFTYDTKAKLIMSYKALEKIGIEKKLPNGNGNGHGTLPKR